MPTLYVDPPETANVPFITPPAPPPPPAPSSGSPNLPPPPPPTTRYSTLVGLLDLPHQLVGKVIVLPEVGNPASVLASLSFIVIEAVAALFNSKLIDCPAVEPPKLNCPDEFNAI
jgi:hypothetical protein